MQANYYTSAAEFGISFPVLKSGVGGVFQDDYRCWRIMLTLAVDAGFLTTGDNGLTLGPASDFNTVVAANDGLCFRPLTNDSYGVFIRQGGAVTFNAAVATGLDVTQFNTIEFRIVGATVTTDAVLKAYVNGVQRQSWSWGAGSILPGLQVNGASMGWNIGCGNRGSPAIYLASGGLRIIAAATEDGLL